MPTPNRRKPATLPDTGCHLYQAPSSPSYFPGLMQVYNRCERHRPAGSLDLGPVGGWCVECLYSPEFAAPAVERLEY